MGGNARILQNSTFTNIERTVGWVRTWAEFAYLQFSRNATEKCKGRGTSLCAWFHHQIYWQNVLSLEYPVGEKEFRILTDIFTRATLLVKAAVRNMVSSIANLNRDPIICVHMCFLAWLTDFNKMSNYVGLYYAKRLENCVPCTFIFTLFV